MYVTSSFAYCYHLVNGIILGRPKMIPSNSFNCIIIATQLLKAALSLSLSLTLSHTHTVSLKRTFRFPSSPFRCDRSGKKLIFQNKNKVSKNNLTVKT